MIYMGFGEQKRILFQRVDRPGSLAILRAPELLEQARENGAGEVARRMHKRG